MRGARSLHVQQVQKKGSGPQSRPELYQGDFQGPEMSVVFPHVTGARNLHVREGDEGAVERVAPVLRAREPGGNSLNVKIYFHRFSFRAKPHCTNLENRKDENEELWRFCAAWKCFTSECWWHATEALHAALRAGKVRGRVRARGLNRGEPLARTGVHAPNPKYCRGNSIRW